MLPKQYEPSGSIYTYIADLDSRSVSYTPLEEKTLESRGRDTTYPGEYSNSVVFGGYELPVDTILTVDPRSTIAQIMSPDTYQSASINLAKPVYICFSEATKLINNMMFGQAEGDTEPAKLVIEAPLSGGVNFKWYKNGSLVATDSILNMGTNIAIAVQYSGTTIRNYAYVYTYNNEIWTSGLKGNANVIQILNEGGYAGSDEKKEGWTDEELGEFIMSKIFNSAGQDAYTGYATSVITGSMPSVDEQLINDLEAKCETYGGWLGTDLVEYMGGWAYIQSMADAQTPVEVKIPTSVEGEYSIITYDYYSGSDPYFILKDSNGNVLGYMVTNIYSRQMGKVFLTWYKQSTPLSSAERFLAVYVNRNGYGTEATWYQLTDFNLQAADVDWEEFDSEQSEQDALNGYDPEKGQEDENQDEPEDTEKPEYDPLASGFLYAFMVGTSDMENLASCLKPDTLAEKIKADFGNNLYEFIVSYHMMPCLTNADSLHKVAIKYRGTSFLYGENDTQLQLAPITQTWYQVNCGTRVCRPSSAKRPDGFENWSQAKVQMYLPFIGYVHLNTADVWGEAITVVYEFDILQGTCVANIGVGDKGTIYSFSASCKYTIPFTTTIDMANQQLLSGIFSGLGAAVSVGGAIATGSPAGMLGAASGVADSVGHFLSAAEHQSIINRGGSLSGAPGWLMPRKPALLVTIPDIVEQGGIYNNLNGLPCCVSSQLSSYTGFYVEVGQIDLKAYNNNNGCSPNDTELDMIRSILKEGVYV